MKRWAPAKSRSFCLGDVTLVPMVSGALYVPDYATLLVADLHLEKATSLARRGLHLPPYDTRASLILLTEAVHASGAKRLILLGDSFHDDGALERIDASDLGSLSALTRRVDTTWITGNHDPSPHHFEALSGGRIVSEVMMGPLTLRHIPSPQLTNEFEIAGHLHPAASVCQRGRYIRRKCFIVDSKRLIMPAFGSYTGSLPISSAPFAGLFKKRDFHVWMLGAQDVHPLPGNRVS